ncbi:MAG: TonB-dependent receptor [Candidatus Eisenbacteria bacterium]|nr:TonB-dependent receptor [Candidatus Eisenbacteria bacterium]
MRTLFVTLALAVLALPARAEQAPATEGDTLKRIVPLPGVEVSTTRLGDRAPLARAIIAHDELTRRNTGMDTPMLLATLPGAYAYSDAGNGIGYSYLSIRGFPQRRISVLINGVPLNDPESHEVYWIDHPDLLAWTTEAQVQRGVGSALYGSSSVGGTVAIETSPFSETPAASATLAYGSWETKRLMLETSSGRLAGGWNFYGRYSRIETQGYREQSWSKLWSYSLAARRTTGNQSLRVNLYGGPEETHLAYLGVPAEYLNGTVTGNRDRDRRFNPITYPNERDHFFEPHYELIHSWAPSERLTLTQTLFWFDGKGYYDEQRFGRSLASYRLSPWWTTDSTLFARDYYAQDPGGALVRDSLGRVQVERFDLVRRRTVANRHYGWVPRVRISHAGGALTVGGELRAHDGRHWGEILTGSGLPPGTGPDHKYYDYHPRTLSGAAFAREEWQVEPRTLVTADLAWRHQGYAMRDDQFDGIRFDQRYDFALPRLGVTFAPRHDLSLFASWAQSRREPAFPLAVRLVGAVAARARVPRPLRRRGRGQRAAVQQWQAAHPPRGRERLRSRRLVARRLGTGEREPVPHGVPRRAGLRGAVQHRPRLSHPGQRRALGAPGRGAGRAHGAGPGARSEGHARWQHHPQRQPLRGVPRGLRAHARRHRELRRQGHRVLPRGARQPLGAGGLEGRERRARAAARRAHVPGQHREHPRQRRPAHHLQRHRGVALRARRAVARRAVVARLQPAGHPLRRGRLHGLRRARQPGAAVRPGGDPQRARAGAGGILIPPGSAAARSPAPRQARGGRCGRRSKAGARRAHSEESSTTRRAEGAEPPATRTQ